MSAWRIVTRILHQHGPLTADWIMAHSGEEVCVRQGLCHAARLGIVVSPGRGGGLHRPWTITQRGIDWCEGRLTLVPAPPKGPNRRPPLRFVATWLSALPRDIRIEQRASA